MKVAIIGFGLEGQAAYDYWCAGNAVTVCDRNEAVEVPAGANSQLGEHYLDGLDRFDVIVRSPNVHPQQLVAANSSAILTKVTSNTNEFLRDCPTKNVIGVTGTKGKGTTSTLITKMLDAAGKRVHLGGNIGVPALELLQHDIQPDDWVVLELSSFQLIDLQRSPHIAVCLMVAPEHLDWHTDLDEYISAKAQLFAFQTPEDVALYYAENQLSQQIASTSAGQHIPYFQVPGAYVEQDQIVIDGQPICRTDELKLLGRHNWQNACAAVTAVWQISQDVAAIRSALTTFSGLEHRLEFVREFAGVRFYDDSFGTTPQTAIVALEAFAEQKVIILGGSDKGADYDALAQVVANGKVRKVLLIGEQAARIQQALERANFSDFIPSGTEMTEIVRNARNVAQPGDVVLLSTACASFDMFANYKDRGNQFKAAVQALA